MPAATPRNPWSALPAFDTESGHLNAVVETPKGACNKYSLDERTGVFSLGAVLSAGLSFPFDFGFVPSTRGQDGDPLDVLLVMDHAAFPGCLVPARLIGVIEVQQTEKDGREERNDRLIAVAADSNRHEHIRSLDDLDPGLLDELERFFQTYTAPRGKKVKPLGRHGPRRAEKLVRAGIEAAEEKARKDRKRGKG
jgi:inorganic pyrophosphatase